MQVGYLNSWEKFRFIWRQLRMTVLHKIMMTKRNNFFSSNAWHIFGNGKVISKCNSKIYLPPFENGGRLHTMFILSSFLFNFCHFIAVLCWSLFLTLECLFSNFSYSFQKSTWCLLLKTDSVSLLILAITFDSNKRSTRFFSALYQINDNINIYACKWI